MRKKLLRMAIILIGLGALMIGFLAFIGPLVVTWPYSTGIRFQLRGHETTPEEFENFEEQWSALSVPHYRMVVKYWSIDPDISPDCRQDLEIKNETVLMEFENTCGGLKNQSISNVFHMFKRFVGSGPTRPEASDGCRYYIVDAAFDKKLGYPQFLETKLIYELPERKHYFAWNVEINCLMIGPPVYGFEVISFTELP